MSSISRYLALEGNIRVLAVQTLLSQLGFGILDVVWQPYILSTGVRVAELGVIQSIINLSSASGLLAWGVLSDKFGRKPVIVLSNASRIAALLALIVSRNILFLLAFALLVGFSALFMMGNPARNALISESVDRGRRATAFGTLMSVSQITNTIAASAGGYLAVRAGYQPIFYICVAGDVIGLVLMVLFVEETYQRRDEVKMESTIARLVGFLKPEKEIEVLYLIMVVMSIGFTTGYSLLYGFLTDSYGFTPFQLGLISTAFNLTWGISSIPLGRLADRFGRSLLIRMSWVMAMITVIGLLMFRRFEMILLFQVTSALDPALWIPAWMGLISDRVPSKWLSTVMGKLDAYMRLVSIPAPWLGGLLYSNFVLSAPLAVHLCCLLISGVLVFSIKEPSGNRIARARLFRN